MSPNLRDGVRLVALDEAAFRLARFCGLDERKVGNALRTSNAWFDEGDGVVWPVHLVVMTGRVARRYRRLDLDDFALTVLALQIAFAHSECGEFDPVWLDIEPNNAVYSHLWRLTVADSKWLVDLARNSAEYSAAHRELFEDK